MNRYRLERRGDPDEWGPYQVVDGELGSNKPIAAVHDPDVAQRIVDTFNGEDKIGPLEEKILELRGEVEARGEEMTRLERELAEAKLYVFKP